MTRSAEMNGLSVLMCIPTLGHGGAENIVARLCAQYAAAGLPVTLLLIQRSHEDVDRVSALPDQVHVRALFSRSVSTTSWLFKLRNLLFYLGSPVWAVWAVCHALRAKAALVHLNLTQFALLSIFMRPLLALLRPSARVVQTFHTNVHLLKSWQRWIFRASWRAVHHVVFEIDRAEPNRWPHALKGVSWSFIPFAVDVPATQGGAVRFQSPLRFGSLARLRLFEKKFDVILKAFVILKRQGVPFSYVIGGDGEDRGRIEQLCRELDLEDRVTLTGYVSDIGAFLEGVDLLVVVTVSGDSGIAGLQALAAGVPLIGVETKPESMGEGGCLRWSSCDEFQLAELLGKMSLRTDAEHKAYYAALAEERADRLDANRMTAAYIDLYRALLAQ